MTRSLRIPLFGGRQIVLSPWEAVFYGLLLVLLFLTRYLDLGSRAYHHDESVHAKTMWDMARGIKYVYEPVYHGPFQYFASAALFWLFEGNDVTGRIIPAAFGVGVVLVIPLLWRKELGKYGTAITMLALTVSTGFMYFSRFARNDIYVAFWTLLILRIAGPLPGQTQPAVDMAGRTRHGRFLRHEGEHVHHGLHLRQLYRSARGLDVPESTPVRGRFAGDAQAARGVSRVSRRP